MKVYCVVEDGGPRRWRFYPVQDSELAMMALPPLGVPMAAFGGYLLAAADGKLFFPGVVLVVFAAVVSIGPCRIARHLLKKCEQGGEEQHGE